MYIADGSAKNIVHVFFKSKKINLVAKITQSAFLCVIFHVKYKKIIVFALISHNDLQTSISNMASSRKIGRLFAEMAPSCFEVS